MDRNEYLLYESLSAVTGEAVRTRPIKKSIQCVGKTSSGTGAATVYIEVSNNQIDWHTAGIFSLSLTTTQISEGFTIDAPWLWTRARISALSGTGAKVSVFMGI